LSDKTMVILREIMGDDKVFSSFPEMFRKEIVAQYYDEQGYENLAAAARYKPPQP